MMEETEYAFLRSRGLCVVLQDDRGTLGFPRLEAGIKIHQPLTFEESATVRLNLMEVDGKTIRYEFEILDAKRTVAIEGHFIAACCRFPGDDLPYAILTPEFVIDALTQETLAN